MSTSHTVHYENAEFFRTLAERLPELLPAQAAPDKIALLHELADDQIEQAEYDEWGRQKVARARTETSPGYTTEEVKARLRTDFEGRKKSA